MAVKITWYSHACFLIETDQARLLIDPFISGNPLATVKPDAIETEPAHDAPAGRPVSESA